MSEPLFTAPGRLGELQTATRAARVNHPHIATSVAKGGWLDVVLCVPRLNANGKPSGRFDVMHKAGPFNLQQAIDYLKGL